MSGPGGNQPNGGGPITIKGGCSMLISGTGIVSSQGIDPGADLVHIEGCEVEILGLVESTGAGHAFPKRGIAVIRSGNPPYRFERSQFFERLRRGLVGYDPSIVNAVQGTTARSMPTWASPVARSGRGWIDLFARGDISITGNARYAVHSNAFSGTPMMAV